MKLGDDESGASVLRRQHPPPQHWLMSLVAVSPSPSIRRMSFGLSEMRVVDARRGRDCSEKLTAEVGSACSLSTTSSTPWSGSVMGVIGASESSLLLVHSVDSPDDLGDVCSGCDCDGCTESWGMSLGSAGMGSSGCEVDVCGMGLGIVAVVAAMCLRGGVRWRRSGERAEDATKGTASANHG